MSAHDILKSLGLSADNSGTYLGHGEWAGTQDAGVLEPINPSTGEVISRVHASSISDYETIVQRAQEAFKTWRTTPAPKRGEAIRLCGEALRKHKDALGSLVALEMGKIKPEGDGEVQEMIDIADFAVGQSRMLYGYTMHSERPGHRMYEQWHPLGVVGIISAFNFPVAVWSWNAALAWVCGNVCIWKPSEKAPLSAIACQHIFAQVLKENNLPEGISGLVIGDYKVGEYLSGDERVPLVSATGSTRMGKIVAQNVAARLGRSLLELGGNNAIIITETADLNITVVGATFGAVGTCGQRCTSTRRLIIHKSVYDVVKNAIAKAYTQLRIGNPLETHNHVGPLIDAAAVQMYLDAIEKAKAAGGRMVVEGGVLSGEDYESGCYVKPCIIEVDEQYDIVRHETFAPILYLLKYDTLDEALALQNGVPQGLSSAIMTNNLRDAERFLSCGGSDCGIANVNIGTSGAEIGGAFGGEKETGGGRESGSDAWKAYMRRQTNTINYSTQLPLAQGIQFDLD